MPCVGGDQQWLLATDGRSRLVFRLGVRLTVGVCVLTILKLLNLWRQLCVSRLGEDLLSPKLGIFALGTNEFIMRALLGNTTLVNHDNTVGVDNGRQAMSKCTVSQLITTPW